MNRTTNGFDKSSLPDFIESLNTICAKMTANPNFPDQQAAVSALCADKGGLLVLAQKSSGGSKGDLLARDAKREEIVFKLRVLGNAVTAVAQGEPMILESSGFPVSKDRTLTPPLVKPDAPKVFAGVNAGEIGVVAQKQVGNERINYLICIEPGNDGTWKAYNSSRSKYLFA